MRRALFAITFALAVVGSGLLPPPTDAVVGAPSGWATWVVDRAAKTITVTVKMQIYLGPCAPVRGGQTGAEGGQTGAEGGPGHEPSQKDLQSGRICATAIADIAKAIKADIGLVWNQGLKYTCYRLIFVVDITFTDDRFSVDANRVGVRIDRSMENSRSHVDPTSEYDGGDRWSSNDPADRVNVDNGLINPTEFGFPPLNTHTYAHEFGHILGLDDQYVEGVWVPKPGAPSDIMSTMNTIVDQSTVDRVVERNRDHLVDKSGDPLDLKDLRCDRLFRATLVAGDRHYEASHHMNSAPECPSPATTSSIDQDLRVDSEYADLNLIETPEAGGVGYRLTPVFDVLMLQNGMAITGRRNVDIGLFDLPVTVDVDRAKARPASGEVPEVRDSRDNTCAGGGGTPPPEVCGRREYKSWMAMSLTGPDEIWPIPSVLPATLRGIANLDARFELLYRNCPGPTPWPGAFARDGGGATVTRGKLPSLQKIAQVADDWFNSGIAGKIEIDGRATLNEARVGFLQTNQYAWTLTLCPLDRDGNPPPGCP